MPNLLSLIVFLCSGVHFLPNIFFFTSGLFIPLFVAIEVSSFQFGLFALYLNNPVLILCLTVSLFIASLVLSIKFCFTIGLVKSTPSPPNKTLYPIVRSVDLNLFMNKLQALFNLSIDEHLHSCSIIKLSIPCLRIARYNKERFVVFESFLCP